MFDSFDTAGFDTSGLGETGFGPIAEPQFGMAQPVMDPYAAQMAYANPAITGMPMAPGVIPQPGFDMYPGMGMPSAYGYTETQACMQDFDVQRLASLGFTADELQALQMVIFNAGKVSPSILNQFGFTYEQSERLKYLYNVICGKVVLESPDDLSKHFRKMFGKHRRIGITDLAVSKVSEVPRLAVLGGLQAPFDVLNSKNYPIKERTYKVVNVSGSRIFIETDRRPVLKYKQSRKIDGMAEITNVTPKNITVAVDKKYAKLCNRFIIVGSLRRPEFHHGMVEMICIEGTRVYVYAQSLGTSDKVNYNFSKQRIYDYGFMGNEIQQKLIPIAKEVYNKVIGVYPIEVPANQDFQVLLPEAPQQDEDEPSIEDDFDEPN